MSPSEKPLPTLHGMYTGMLHQIVSQRPALFRPIQTLAADILHQDIWTEQNVLVLLKVVLRHCRNIWFLIVIHEFERWPFAIKSWWSETLRQILGSRGSTVIFLTSSASLVSGLTQSKPHTIFVEAEYEQHKRQFAKEWSEELLAHIAGPLTFKDSLRHRLESLVAQTQLFDGSIATLSSYIEKVFSSITLNTTDAITSALEESPQTMEQLYKREILTLRAKPLVQAWAASAVSWVLWSVQPLQVEELATAVAINLDDSDICQVRPKISIAMRQDLQMHLSAFVRMENQRMFICSKTTRCFLSKSDTCEALMCDNVSKSTKVCLHYLRLLLKDMNPGKLSKCRSQVLWNFQTPAGDSQDPVFQFLDYACRYWPAHFLSAKKPDPDLISAAVEFLLDPEIAKLWFELYLLSTSPFDLHPHNDEHVTETAGVASEAGSRLVESDLEREYDPEITHSIKPMDNQQSAAPAKPMKVLHVRRGCTERFLTFHDPESKGYLDCVISNDDDMAAKELLASNEDKRTKYLPLHRAASGGCLKTAQVLLDLLDDPGQIDRDGRTPLHLATLGGHVEIVRLLLGKCEVTDTKKRTDIPHIIDAQDGKRQTPLMLASQMGHIDCARHLIESGADISIKDAIGKTVVHYAVLNCPEIIKYVAGQYSMYSIDNEGCTPLHIAAKYGSVEATSILLSVLLRSEKPTQTIKALDNAKKTALTHAAEKGHTEVVKILLERQGHAVTYDE
ncbi:ankyrin repeat-containing domain protein [Aspergillus parasiticus]|uniref:Ankyrin repeat-containing domain protein n=1 Tax=Aspergillus parasiticus TaxID=5067 RepID=A0A5N6D389_ASPPA|nr:ankyrin repeat-containing domain protein [Aspergillus parasiticus]